MSERFIKGIIHLLIVVLLSTVLSPTFGRETSESQATHGHDVVALVDYHDGSVAQHQNDDDSHHHHGCAGHLLSHLQGQLSDPFVFAILDPSGSVLPGPASDFSSYLPEGLDRPPLVPVLA